MCQKRLETLDEAMNFNHTTYLLYMYSTYVYKYYACTCITNSHLFKFLNFYFLIFSQFQCTVFSSWDQNKDWSQQLPKGESIEVKALFMHTTTLLIYICINYVCGCTGGCTG